MLLPNAVLVGVNDTPRNNKQRQFLEKVSKAMGDIEYKEFRRQWLEYQQCKIDVVQFFKKIKLLFRGSRYIVHSTLVDVLGIEFVLLINRGGLREGTKILLDPVDFQTFNDLLAGKEVVSKTTKGR